MAKNQDESPRWEDMRGIAAELARERMDLVTRLRDGARALAQSEAGPEELRARAAELHETADEKLGLLQQRVQDLARRTRHGISEPDALAEEAEAALRAHGRDGLNRLERRAQHHDTALRERLEGRAPTGLVRSVQAYPWAALELVATLALLFGFAAGAVLGRASKRGKARS